MEMGLRTRMVLVLGLAAAAALSGCAMDADDTSDLDGEEGFAAGEVTGTTADSAEQALVANGCYIQVRTRKSKYGGMAGHAEYSCSPSRTITIGVCVDRYGDGRWTSVKCTGAKQVYARSDSTGELATPASYNGGPWYRSPGTYRVRARAAGYGTATSANVIVPQD
jgi:hypothetical protein